ncbi:hypothetical protein HNV12_06500 [Methanococcoides sp. SA1]|nr:hypothetical protein [Methanococcoides sp. SA1]
MAIGMAAGAFGMHWLDDRSQYKKGNVDRDEVLAALFYIVDTCHGTLCQMIPEYNIDSLASAFDEGCRKGWNTCISELPLNGDDCGCNVCEMLSE